MVTNVSVRRWQLAHPKPTSTHPMKTRHGARIFRFLDLPAELRNQVYKLVLDHADTIELNLVQWPNLAQVSHQLLQETLPLFFSINRFRITILCNFNHVTRTLVGSQDRRYINGTGQVLFDTEAFHAAVERCGTDILLRYVRFDIITHGPHGPECVARLDMRKPGKPGHALDGYCRFKPRDEKITDALGQMVVRAVATDKERHTKGEVLGWRLEDLRAIAACFRGAEEGDAEVTVAPQ